MTEQRSETEPNPGNNRELRIAYGVAAVKLVFVLTLLRLCIPMATLDILDHQFLPLPTWEWSLASITPCILVYLCRRDEDWKELAILDLGIVKTALFFYMGYGLAMVLYNGAWMLWIAVAAGPAGLLSIWHLNRKMGKQTQLIKQSPGTQQHDRNDVEGRVDRRMIGVKVVFALALLRLFAPIVTEDLLGHQFLPLPTWEWSLASATPCILIYLCRHPEDWKELVNFQQLYIELFLYAYLLYGLIGAFSYEKSVLWIAVANCAVAKISIWLLNLRTKRRERAAAGNATT